MDTAYHRHDDSHRPGFPRRPCNFEDIRAQAVRWRGDRVSKDRLVRAVAFGTPMLTLQERAMLFTLIGFLSREQIESGAAFVFASNHTLAELIGSTESTVRRLKGRLEHAGLVVRNMTNSNRPDYGYALDLRVLFARLNELEGTAAATFRACRERGDTLHASAIYEEAELPPLPGNSAPHIQSTLENQKNTVPREPEDSRLLENQKNTVPREPEDSRLAAATRSITERRQASPAAAPNRNTTAYTSTIPGRTTESATAANASFTKPQERDKPLRRTRRSPSGAGGTNQPGTPQTFDGERARQRVLQAIGLSPTMQSHLGNVPLESSSLDVLVDTVEAAIPKLLPDRETAHTWAWAVRNHGWRAVPMLVVALEDQTVRDPYRYFGALAVSPTPPDLTTNLARVRYQQKRGGGTRPAARGASSSCQDPADDPVWRAIKAGLLHDGMPEAELRIWIAPLTYRGIDAKVLRLATTNRVVRDRVDRQYGSQLRAAARAAGLAIADVEVLHVSSS